MTSITASVRVADETMIDDLVNLCVEAFSDEALTVWTHPDPAARTCMLREMFGYALHTAVPAGGVLALTTSTGNPMGAAFWEAQPPSPPADTVGEDPLSQRLRSIQQVTSHHRPRTPHFYLASMAIHPEYRNHGFGTALLSAVIQRAREAKQMIYLEASSQDNLRFYRRHGFVDHGKELVLPDTQLRLYPMSYAIR